MSETQEFEAAVAKFCTYLKEEKKLNIMQICNCVKNIGSMEVDMWDQRGGE